MSAGARVARPRRRRWPWVVGAIVVALAAVYTWALWPPLRKPFDDEVARLRAAGFATTFAEWYGDMPADEENGALAFVDALGWLDAELGSEDSWGVPGPWDTDAAEPWQNVTSTADQLAALRVKLDGARPFFDRVDAAIAKPRFKFKVVLDAQGMFTSDSAVQHLLRTTRLLQARAVAAGTAEDRAAAIRALARLGSRQESPSTIDTFVGMAAWTRACTLARDAVESGSLSAAQCRQALEPWPSERRLDALGRLARGDIAWLPDPYDAALDGRATWMRTPSAVDRLEDSFRRIVGRSAKVRPTMSLDITPADVAEGLRTWSEVAAYRPGTHAETQARVDALQARTSPGAQQITSFVPRMVRMLTQGDAQIALARVALAARERFDATGAWPASLQDLAASFPDGVTLDPMTGAPFVYEVSETSVRIATSAPAPGGETQETWLRENVLVWEFSR